MSLSRKSIVSNDPDVFEDKVALNKASEAQTLVRIAEYGGAAGIFASHLGREGFAATRAGWLRWLLLPGLLVAAAIDSALSIRRAYLERKIQGYNNNITLADVAVNFGVFALITSAAVLGFVSYAAATPVLIAGLALKSAFDFGSSIYHLAQSFRPAIDAIEQAERLASRKLAVSTFLSGVTNALLTVGVSLLQLVPGVGQLIPLALAFAGTILGIASYAYTRKTREKHEIVREENGSDPDSSLSSSASMQKGLGIFNRVTHMSAPVVPMVPRQVATSTTNTSASYDSSLRSRMSATPPAGSGIDIGESQPTDRRGMRKGS
jgi:hypothetical protein